MDHRGHEDFDCLQLRRARTQQVHARVHCRAADPAVPGVSTYGQDAELASGHTAGTKGRRLVLADAFQKPVPAPVQQGPWTPVWFAAWEGNVLARYCSSSMTWRSHSGGRRLRAVMKSFSSLREVEPSCSGTQSFRTEPETGPEAGLLAAPGRSARSAGPAGPRSPADVPRSCRHWARAAQQTPRGVLKVVGAAPAQDAKRLPGLVAEHGSIVVAGGPPRWVLGRPLAGPGAGATRRVRERGHWGDSMRQRPRPAG